MSTFFNAANYSLRPSTGRFDLREKHNLTRQTVKRYHSRRLEQKIITQVGMQKQAKLTGIRKSKQIASMRNLGKSVEKITPHTPISSIFEIATTMSTPAASVVKLPLTIQIIAEDDPFTELTSDEEPVPAPCLSIALAPREEEEEKEETPAVPVALFATPDNEWKQAEDSLRLILRDHQRQFRGNDALKPDHFAQMDDESLFEIFNHLTLNDLCITAEVSIHLRLAAQKYFEIMYTSFKLSWLADNDGEKFTLHQARRLLQCFGSLISTLIVDTTKMDQPDRDMEKLPELIGIHCCGVLFWNTK